MKTIAKRATIYLSSDLHKALRVKASVINNTISVLVNNAEKLSLAEDTEDLTAFEQMKYSRAKNRIFRI